MALRSEAAGLAGFYGQVADEVARPQRSNGLAPIPAPAMMGPAVPRSGAAPDGARAEDRAAGSRPEDSGTEGSGTQGTAAVNGAAHPHLLWVQEHLHHLSQSAQTVSEPAFRVAEVRRRPWWR